MSIRPFQPGDEGAKVTIYNEAASDLPKFKPASLDEVRRRCQSADFDKNSLFFAFEDGQPVGYAGFTKNGRVSFPWCLKGEEAWAEPLFQAVLEAVRKAGIPSAFAAYRGDWPIQKEFLLGHGFTQVREMINYYLDLAEMPTPAAAPVNSMSEIKREDVPEILKLAPEALRLHTAEVLEKHLFQNAYFKPSDLYVLRERSSRQPIAIGLVIENKAYADPKVVDSNMPCFRLGAFGTEGMTVKRINGMYSFLVKPDRDANRLGLEIMGHAASRLDAGDLSTIAAQVPSDVPHLARFYQQYFRRQGSFPVFERKL